MKEVRKIEPKVILPTLAERPRTKSFYYRDSTRLWVPFILTTTQFFIERILKKFHFWESYKFSLHLRLYIVKTSFIRSTYSLWCSVVSLILVSIKADPIFLEWQPICLLENGLFKARKTNFLSQGYSGLNTQRPICLFISSSLDQLIPCVIS